MIVHPIPPLYDAQARILILGSFPSVKSRETMFFYGHPQNRFWKVIAAVFHSDVPQTIDEKKRFILNNHIALWDVIASCSIVGSADSTIRNVVANNIQLILENSNITHIFVNGKTAEKYYNRYVRDTVGREAFVLPSTSPANAAWSLEKLVEAWKIIIK